MAEEYFYHYTSKRCALEIYLSGKILSSLPGKGGAIHGPGVYLTTLDPKLGKKIVGKNNWDGVAASQADKMECYFEILIPTSRVRRARDMRDIEVYPGELILSKYKWSLKSWRGDLLATQFFMISSEGEAARYHSATMGRYTLCNYVVTQDNIPVYKHDHNQRFLFRYKGCWVVGNVIGLDQGIIQQLSNKSTSPDKTIPWQYYDVKEDKLSVDETLRVYPCY